MSSSVRPCYHEAAMVVAYGNRYVPAVHNNVLKTHAPDVSSLDVSGPIYYKP